MLEVLRRHFSPSLVRYCVGETISAPFRSLMIMGFHSDSSRKLVSGNGWWAVTSTYTLQYLSCDYGAYILSVPWPDLPNREQQDSGVITVLTALPLGHTELHHDLEHYGSRNTTRLTLPVSQHRCKFKNDPVKIWRLFVLSLTTTELESELTQLSAAASVIAFNVWPFCGLQQLGLPPWGIIAPDCAQCIITTYKQKVFCKSQYIDCWADQLLEILMVRCRQDSWN